ncbi:MAG: DMT family transporter [Candidatus Cloacimonadales bacterium]|jgi:drug/metabolite transporter (DMT)-like permease|nr:DMT family transporter [Candidatus Cloacimonadota bacterium]MDD3501840.1 DMT family transporter [Candidatus Cloacimonadota bacterium]MDX9977546.1 DMT family transporter [Candidatus Cloacimonadales bacterium]
MNIGFIYALIALFLWGIHGPAGRYLALQNVDMYYVFAVRFWLGSLVFFIYLLFKRALRFSWIESWKQVLLISSIGVFGNSLLYHLTLVYLPGTFVMVLENLAPIFVLFASFIYLGIKPSLKEIIALFISFLGIAFIAASKGSYPELQDGYYIGIVLGILTGVSFGAYTFYSAQYVKPLKREPLKIIQFLFKVFLLSSIMASPFVVLRSSIPSTRLQWFWLIEMGIFQSGLAYIFWNYALAHLKTSTASILFILTIVFTTIKRALN